MHAVVGTDFSEGAKQALERALMLPWTQGGVVSIVHVLAKAGATNAAEAGASLNKLKKLAESRFKEGSIETHLLKGEPYEEFLRFTEQCEPQLAVLGRHGAWRFKDLLLGTTTERIIRRLRIPVLVTNTPAAQRYTSMLAALDNPPDASQRSVELGLGMLQRSEPTLHAIHVLDDTYDWALRRAGRVQAEMELEARARRSSAEAALEEWLITSFPEAGAWTVHVETGEPRDRILHTVKRLGCDLLVMGTHGRKTFGRMFLGSVSEIVLRKAKCDVLVAGPVPASG